MLFWRAQRRRCEPYLWEAWYEGMLLRLDGAMVMVERIDTRSGIGRFSSGKYVF